MAERRNLGTELRLGANAPLAWTGERVIAHGYSAEHVSEVTTRLNGKPFIWDNAISRPTSGVNAAAFTALIRASRRRGAWLGGAFECNSTLQLQ